MDLTLNCAVRSFVYICALPHCVIKSLYLRASISLYSFLGVFSYFSYFMTLYSFIFILEISCQIAWNILLGFCLKLLWTYKFFLEVYIIVIAKHLVQKKKTVYLTIYLVIFFWHVFHWHFYNFLSSFTMMLLGIVFFESILLKVCRNS